MGFGIAGALKKAHLRFLFIKFSLRKCIYGFDDAVKILINAPKEIVIPLLLKNKATIGENCDIESPIFFHNCRDLGNLSIGNNCHIGKNCFFDLRDKISIGENVIISMGNTFITHMDVSKSELSKIYNATSKEVVLGNNVYIGANSTVLMGVRLGVNSFVAAGSVVTKDVPNHSLCGGVPAKEIKNLKTIYEIVKN